MTSIAKIGWTSDGIKAVLPSQGGERRVSSIQYPKDIAPPAPAPCASAPLPLKPPLSFSLVLVLSSARLAATGGGGPAACYRHNPSSPSFSLSLQVQSPPPPFIPADCKRGFSPLDEKRSKQVGSPWSDLQRRKEK